MSQVTTDEQVMITDNGQRTTDYYSSLITHHFSLQSFTRDKLDEIADAAGIAPLVVVPGEDFN
jgi:hypothetical protein